MKWTLKQKAAVAVLALAGAAFCVDRFVLGYSAPAAAVGAPVEATTASAAPLPEAALPVAFHGASLTQRVSALASGDDLDKQAVPDAFAMPPRWKTVPHAKDDVTKNDKVAASRHAFTLTTVITAVGDHPAAARINGRLVKVGEQIDGRTLLRIEQGRSYTAVLGPRAGDADGPDGENAEIRVPFAAEHNTLSDEPDPATPKS